MNWYRKALNTKKLDWDKIHSDFNYHTQQILSGKKPAGHFDYIINDQYNYTNYPQILDFVKLVKSTRPDLSVYYVEQIQKDNMKVKAYVIGKDPACISIVEGIRRLTHQGFHDNKAHELFGKGVGYTPEEIKEFVAKTDADRNQVELEKQWAEEHSEVEPKLIVKKI